MLNRPPHTFAFGARRMLTDPLIFEAVAGAAAIPVALGTAIALRRRSVELAPRPPSRRATRALISKLPHRHRREAKAIVALARDHERRGSASRLDAFTTREALRSYLPETIEAYLVVPKDLRGRVRNGAPSADRELSRQLQTLRAGLERLRDGDADAAAARMAENRTFLNERFGALADDNTPQPTIVERINDFIADVLGDR